ncbi:angiopoietin-related protein 1-like [Anopheles darlingi]|uniref:angiopoietin-related protein 1-like n=1 Tax=Anopheles darlingi TaxID=43151 RepID=UPI0021003427|nr:angiopoietin-related protein 1-like [Anopheles darlingi]
MKLRVCFLLVCATVYAGATNDSSNTTDGAFEPISATDFIGLGVEILTKLEQLDSKLMKLQSQMERLENNQISYESLLKNIARRKTTTKKPRPSIYASCKDAPETASGVYSIRIDSDSAPFQVYCEQEKFDGGWIVVQHRFDGSVDFYQNWTEYRDGFGELDSEFWLGLEHLHQLTTARKYELLVEVKDFTGIYGYARYSAFQVGSECEQYNLKTLGSYTGTGRDSLEASKGYKFSTKDRDDPSSGTQYAISYKGGWWHNGGIANLNGPYKDNAEGSWWFTLRNDFRGLSFTRMMIRETGR